MDAIRLLTIAALGVASAACSTRSRTDTLDAGDTVEGAADGGTGPAADGGTGPAVDASGANPLFVAGVLAPHAVTDDQPCTYSSSPTQPFLSSGILDIDFSFSYLAEYLIGNRLVSTSDAARPWGHTSEFATIQGAIVRVTDAAGSPLVTFDRLAVAAVAPAAGNEPGYAPVGISVLDRDTLLHDSTIGSLVVNAPARSATVRLFTYVRFFGKTLAGDPLESDEYSLPVDICKGCLIVFPPRDVNPDAGTPNCLGACGLPDGSTTQQPVPCNVGQDLPIDCAQCRDVPDCQPDARTLGASDGGC